MKRSTQPFRLGLVVVGGRAGDPGVVDLGLVVGAAEAGAAVVAEGEPGGDCALDRAEALAAELAQEIGGGEAVDPERGVRPGLAAGVVDDGNDGGATLARPGLGRLGRPERVGHRDGDRALMQPLCALAHAGGRGEQAGLPGQPQHPLATRADTAAPEARPQLAVALAQERRVREHVPDLGQQLAVRHRPDRARSSSSTRRDARPAALLARRRPRHARHPTGRRKRCG
jgi:hypothetical protein